MSWSVTFIGKPKKVIDALDKHIESMGNYTPNPSKEEYEEALPHLKALIGLNIGENKIIKLSANGHAGGGEKTCNVTLSIEYGIIL